MGGRECVCERERVRERERESKAGNLISLVRSQNKYMRKWKDKFGFQKEEGMNQAMVKEKAATMSIINNAKPYKECMIKHMNKVFYKWC